MVTSGPSALRAVDVSAPAPARPAPPARRPAGPRSELSDRQVIDTWQQVRRALGAVDARLACALSTGDVPGALVHEALAAIAASPAGMLSVAELAAQLGLSAGRGAKLADLLTATGLAYRRHGRVDRRVVHLALTADGIAHEQVSTVDHAQQLRIELSVLGADRLAELREICDVLTSWSPA